MNYHFLLLIFNKTNHVRIFLVNERRRELLFLGNELLNPLVLGNDLLELVFLASDLFELSLNWVRVHKQTRVFDNHGLKHSYSVAEPE